MTTKVYGVDMEVLQKLYQFQFLLKRRKFNKEFDKMEFLAYVQLKSEKETIPVIKQISVVNTSILIEEGITISKYQLLKIEKNDDNNHVVVKFKKPIWGLGSFISFDFKTKVEKKDFLDAIREIEIDESDVEQSEMTPPGSDDSSN
ncbi:uncharacterized protein LOC123014067 [Tribolium madens]|uniref:uncharacterized protein LOC123014067 n=1 Tax=Tribolium madens TaxID=41895 RepID=UPI001CF73A8E|nr:uncharacterized protein LOC123014067 [Tribolium madens]